ncbi:uncharacterized protein LOC113295102 [Papaver somniferum]|uniref:uncharacterized protein LOC113295102 n=1 Tax=Papaver somniferum TaxID=3469 RepID=UPI000E6FF4EE|nr:uncharacterized protein LOC113295102 [Papaver somniferum]
MSVSGSLDFILTYKLKRLKGVIKEWNLPVFGNILSRLKQDQLRFETVALCSDEDPKDITKLNIMKDAMAKLSDTRLQQLSMLKQKARNQWLVEGSSNTNFFHNNIRIRRSSNTISELVDGAGNTISYDYQLRDHVVHYYEDKFNGPEFDCDPSLFDYEHISISKEESLSMDRIPTPEEIKQVVFDLGADSAPGPDGFSVCFYRHCWDTIKEDLIKDIIFCWNTGHIPNGVNSSMIILLPKVRGANTLRNFRLIGLSNFFFKIFTKILASRLGSVLDNLVSEEQVAFMKGRNIHENISLASEMVNEIHIKRKDGNIVLKLDISQAFDTVSWSFVMEVFRRYGFSEKWCTWILHILNSARISILLNGSPEGYFKINSGLRQGDPLSPLIFFLIEDVLSRNITKLFPEKKMSHMVTRGGISPTRLFFADDIMIFCKGNLRSLHNMVDLLGKYQRASGQIVCRQNSKIYYGGGSLSRRKYLADYLGMSVTNLPDRYLGVKIIPGTVRYHHIFNVVEKIKVQLAGQVFGRNGCIKTYGVKSTILPGIRKVYNTVEANTKVLLGDGKSTYLYYDAWYGERSVADILNDNTLDRLVMVSDCLIANQWVIPDVHMERLLAAGLEMDRLPSLLGGPDTRIWMPNFSGVFSVSSAKELIRQKHARAWNWISDIFGLSANYNLVVSFKIAKSRSKMIRDMWLVVKLVVRSELWAMRNKCVFERKKTNWNLFYKHVLKLIQDYSVRLRGYMLNSAEDVMILDYFRVVHSVKHQQHVEVFWQPPDDNELQICCDGPARGNPGIAGDGVVARDANCAVLGAMSISLSVTSNYLAELYEIIVGLEWAMQWGFERICVRSDSFGVVEAFKNSSIPWFSRSRWMAICRHYVSISYRKVKHSVPKECYWAPPNHNELLLCTDGASRGNPGVAGAGVVERNTSSEVVGGMCNCLGIASNYMAELYGFLAGLEWDTQWG